MAPRTVLQGGRRKAYRPLPEGQRAAAVLAAVDAWERGDWFETHELLEPAWMGTADVGERLRLQALIKLAAAFVHLARGNRAGVEVNLLGAQGRIRDAEVEGMGLPALAEALDGLRSVAGDPARPLTALVPPDLRALLGLRPSAPGAAD